MSIFKNLINDINFSINLIERGAFTDSCKYIGSCFNYLEIGPSLLSQKDHLIIKTRANDCAVEIVNHLNSNDFYFMYTRYYNHLQKLKNSSNLMGEEYNLVLGVFANLKNLEKFSDVMNLDLQLKSVSTEILSDIFSTKEKLKSEEKFILKNVATYIPVNNYKIKS